MASLSEPGALDEAQNMQQVLAWVMRDASAAAGGGGNGSAMMSEDGDGSSLPDVLAGAYDLDPADANLAIALEAEVRRLPGTCPVSSWILVHPLSRPPHAPSYLAPNVQCQPPCLCQGCPTLQHVPS